MEGKKVNSSNYLSEGFRYVKARESESIIYVKCSLFRSHSCQCFGKINKSAKLFEIATNNGAESYIPQIIEIICEESPSQHLEVYVMFE